MAWKARELRRIQAATDQRLDAELADSFPASDVPSRTVASARSKPSTRSA
jgi:hypothetical protein